MSQIDDPTYLRCKELTRILNPLDEAGDSFRRDSFHLKDMLKDIEKAGYREFISKSSVKKGT